jgi:hypothetical protein
MLATKLRALLQREKGRDLGRPPCATLVVAARLSQDKEDSGMSVDSKLHENTLNCGTATTNFPPQDVSPAFAPHISFSRFQGRMTR